MLGTAILGATFGLPLAASVYAVLASIVGVAALWYNWRAARKERALSLKNLAGAKNLLVAGLIATGLLGALGGGASLGSFSPSGAASRNAGLAEYLAAAPAPAASTAGGEAPAAAASAAPAADAPAPFKTDADMVASVKPSVVEIIVQMSGGTAIGSGVIVSPAGLLVTNGHVVGDKAVGEIVEVKLSNDQVLPAKIMAVNHNRDIAILRLPNQKGGKPWPYSTFAKDAPREGDPLLAMGHPLGLPFTVTKGVLSGLGDRGNMFVQYLQTDASINHGNSGGPIYNSRGEVVGINTMIAGKEGSIGIGFSITAPNVVQALEQYAATGGIATAALGVIVDLSSPDQPDAGVAVEFVRAGSAAAKAGLLPGDLIVGVGEDKIAVGGEKAVHSLAAALAQAKPGDVLTLAVLHGDADKPRLVPVTLDARATSEETSMAHGFDGGHGEP
jgi:S1-C subfamily serine protease